MKYKFDQFINEIENPKIELKGFAEVIFTTEKYDKQAIVLNIEITPEIEKVIQLKLQEFEVK